MKNIKITHNPRIDIDADKETVQRCFELLEQNNIPHTMECHHFCRIPFHDLEKALNIMHGTRADFVIVMNISHQNNAPSDTDMHIAADAARHYHIPFTTCGNSWIAVNCNHFSNITHIMEYLAKRELSATFQ